MAEIRIESKPVLGFYHAYLVYVSDSGNESVIRGGPLFGFPPFGPIIVEVGTAMADSEDNRPVADRALHGSTVLNLGGRDARRWHPVAGSG